MKLQDRVAVITGAGAGLGRESALLFADEGARVVVTDINEPRARACAALIEERGGKAIALRTDVRREADVAAAVDAAVSNFGRLDVMFANAGVAVPGFGQKPFDELTEEDWRFVVDVNMSGVFYCMKHAARVMKTSGGGAIVATTSAGGLRAYPGFAVYCASKGGANMLVTAAAVDLGGYGIRVNAICPTHGMSANFAAPENDEILGLSYEEAAGPWDPDARSMPLRVSRAPGLRDHAAMALFLASDDSAYMSGVCIPTGDGGSIGRVGIFFPGRS